MASSVSICNSALIKIGAKTITSLTDGGKNATACNEQYSKKRDELLRAHNWNFATARQKIAQLTSTPAFEFDYEYQLPSDNLKVRSAYDNTDGTGNIVYKIEGRKLLTSVEDVYLKYTQQVTDVNDMPPDFREALSYLLAADLAISIANSKSLKEQMGDGFRAMLRKARSTDAIEDTPDEMPDGSWITDRE